jgi:hypothetical protein
MTARTAWRVFLTLFIPALVALAFGAWTLRAGLILLALLLALAAGAVAVPQLLREHRPTRPLDHIWKESS